MNGLDLNETYYREIVRPILDVRFPDLPHAAALIGWGSEVLGFDDDTSQDHNWGLRFWLFLREEDLAGYSDHLDDALAEDLPEKFLGYPTLFEYAEQKSEKSARHN